MSTRFSSPLDVRLVRCGEPDRPELGVEARLRDASERQSVAFTGVDGRSSREVDMSGSASWAGGLVGEEVTR